MTNFLVFPKVDGAHVFPPEVRQAIADSPEIAVKLAVLNPSYAQAANTTMFHALGDSITANGVNFPSAGFSTSNSQSYMMWAHILSGAKIRIGTIGATGGYTSTQIRNTHLPTVLAAIRPGDRVSILAGTNDGGLATGRGGSEARSNFIYMWSQIRAKGGIPVVCTIPPASADDASSIASRIKWNMWLEHQARANGYPFVDFYSILTDPSTNGFKTGFNVDNLHPNGGGARAMGKLYADTLMTPDLKAPYLATFNIGTGSNTAHPANGVLVWGNACFLADTNVAGRGDQFAYTFGTLSGGSKVEMVIDPNVVGRVMRVIRGVTGPDDINVVQDQYAGSAIPGNRYYAAFKFKFEMTDPTISSSTKCSISITTGDGTVLAGINGGFDFATNQWCIFATEFTMPNAGVNSIQVSVQAIGGSCTTQIGQLTIVDLTAEAVL